ncbi:MAG: DUF6259 domain-containing protein [Bacteroidota bacterium]|nr:DUF6259 domain-containing protein [Bacteroidota bacterium]
MNLFKFLRIYKTNIILISIAIIYSVFTSACQTDRKQNESKENVVNTRYYKLKINNNNGALTSFMVNGREMAAQHVFASLFDITLRNSKGDSLNLSSLQSTKFKIRRTENDSSVILTLNYYAVRDLPVDVTVTITCPVNNSLTYWNIQVNNQTDQYIDHIDFPNVKIPNDLIGNKGDARIFLPHMEGVLLEDLSIRKNSWLRPVPLEYPHTGWIGYYPASSSMQFMAYYSKDAGLYFGAHDTGDNVKGIQVYEQEDNSILMQYRLFPGGIKKGEYIMPYNMVLGGFIGDWYVAADIYRQWLEKNDASKIVKLVGNKRLPPWFEKSPVIVTYPVRGTKDLGDMTPNEYYPYTNALPVIEKFSEKTDSKIMALLMHWEGSAPWAPPYVWPPYGGLGNFTQFEKKLHEKGNLLGLYASGTGYTVKSNTDTAYNMTAEFNEKKLSEVMTIAPDGNLATNGVCTGANSQRIGYDMCPANTFVKTVVADEIKKILPHNIDYLQFFDQNIGGNCYFCYSTKHCHPPVPGKWMNDAMINIYKEIQSIIDNSGKKMIVGCEGAACKPFIPYLLMNDLRYNMNLAVGRPVPAYAYLNHEYLNNFMGNSGVNLIINFEKSPLNLQQRIAYSFIAGDLFTLMIESKGQISWGWGTPWDQKVKPDTESSLKLIRNLNAWRKHAGKDFLLYGRMEPPFTIEGSYDRYFGDIVPLVSVMLCHKKRDDFVTKFIN